MTKLVIFDWMGTLYERNKGPFLHSERVLEELKRRNYQIGLISLIKKDTAYRKAEIHTSGLLKYFDYTQIVSEKNEDCYIKCMRHFGRKPGNTAIVDDRVDRGIQIGNKIGCTTYWINEGEHSKKLPNKETGNPTYTIKSVEDLLTLLY